MKRILELFVCLALAPMLSAQEFRATISGVVADPSGAPVPQARVIVTNMATNVTTGASTNSAGVYAVPYRLRNLPDRSHGRRLRCRCPPGNHAPRGRQGQVGFPTPGGSSSRTGNDFAAAPLINTATATSGQVVDRRTISELPLPDGNPDQLVLLDPGAIYTGSGLQFNRLIDVKHSSQVVVNGAPGTNEFYSQRHPGHGNHVHRRRRRK